MHENIISLENVQLFIYLFFQGIIFNYLRKQRGPGQHRCVTLYFDYHLNLDKIPCLAFINNTSGEKNTPAASVELEPHPE